MIAVGLPVFAGRPTFHQQRERAVELLAEVANVLLAECREDARPTRRQAAEAARARRATHDARTALRRAAVPPVSTPRLAGGGND